MKWKPKPTPQDEPFIPEYVSEDYFSTQSLKRAVWQYLIDHSRIVDDEGTISFHFYMPNEKEFWYRVKARDENKFKRVEMVEFQEKLHWKHKSVQELRVIKNKYLDLTSRLQTKENSDKSLKNFIERKKKSGTLKERIYLRIAEKMTMFSRFLTNKVIHK